MSAHETLEQRLGLHVFAYSEDTACSCGARMDDYPTRWYAEHLADVVRAWLAEQAQRNDVRELVQDAMFVTELPQPVLATFLAALDRRPDGPGEAHSADLRAEQAAEAESDGGDSAGLSDAANRIEQQLAATTGRKTFAELQAETLAVLRQINENMAAFRRDWTTAQW